MVKVIGIRIACADAALHTTESICRERRISNLVGEDGGLLGPVPAFPNVAATLHEPQLVSFKRPVLSICRNHPPFLPQVPHAPVDLFDMRKGIAKLGLREHPIRADLGGQPQGHS